MLLGPIMLLSVVPALRMAIMGNSPDDAEPSALKRIRKVREQDDDDLDEEPPAIPPGTPA
jgi:hypothetical protein